jgi:hypothetical protein
MSIHREVFIADASFTDHLAKLMKDAPTIENRKFQADRFLSAELA